MPLYNPVVNRVLEIREIDGTPDVSDVTIIEVSNGTLTDDGGGQVTVTTGGGGGGGIDTFTAAYGSRPAPSNDGDLFLPNDGFVIERDTGAAWIPWGPLFPFVQPVSGDFAWINQGGASVVTTNGGIRLLAPADASNNLRIRKKAAPSPPYVITAAVILDISSQTFNQCGLLFRESSSGKCHTLGYYYSNLFSSDKWTDPTTFSAAYGSIALAGSAPLFLRIADDNTNRILSYSRDGQNFNQITTIGRTDFLTADEVGFWAASINATYPAALTLLSWQES